MPRALVLGNGNMLITLDNKLMIRDLYYPHVGMEDHTTYNHFHRIGVWADDQISWLYNDEWKSRPEYMSETLVGNSTTENHRLQLHMRFNDCVLSDKNIFIRKITIKNNRDQHRKIRMFFHQDFHIYGEKLQDTALYEPVTNSVVHYRKRRYFMANGSSIYGDMHSYSIGKSEYQGFQGTWKDAEDGHLEKNPIGQGSVDSTVQFNIELKPHGEEVLYFWICAGKKISEINKLNLKVITQTPQKLINQTENYWKSWVNKREFTSQEIDTDIIKAFKQSLLIVRTQIDNEGAIIAANDSDIMKFNKDTYTYMWPRDGALVATILDQVGYGEITKRFYTFCADVMTDSGFLLHKYNPDKSLGSSWHPWFRDGKKQLPIQEDETALTIYSLYKHYTIFKDLEFILKVYDPIVKKGAEFIYKFVDSKTQLPYPSYDLWEEHMGVFTFTCASVIAALRGAAILAQAVGECEKFEKYNTKADQILEATLKYMWDEDRGHFIKKVKIDDHGNITERDTSVESSCMAMFYFGILSPHDEKMVKHMRTTKEKLTIKTHVGGMARYEKDYYHKNFPDHEFETIPGNPWYITTLWYAQWLTEIAKTEEDLTEVKDILHWCIKHANSAYIMPEQLDPYTGKQISVAPLTWTHATFVETVLKYGKKIHKIKGISACEIMSLFKD